MNYKTECMNIYPSKACELMSYMNYSESSLYANIYIPEKTNIVILCIGLIIAYYIKRFTNHGIQIKQLEKTLQIFDNKVKELERHGSKTESENQLLEQTNLMLIKQMHILEKQVNQVVYKFEVIEEINQILNDQVNELEKHANTVNKYSTEFEKLKTEMIKQAKIAATKHKEYGVDWIKTQETMYECTENDLQKWKNDIEETMFQKSKNAAIEVLHCWIMQKTSVNYFRL
jgi:hypothetical protein